MDKKKIKILLKEYKDGKLKNGYEIGRYFYELKKYKKAIIYFESYLNCKDYIYDSKTKEFLGNIYYNGYGVKEDVEKAFKYYDYIAYNNEKICKLLADSYYYGRKVKKDLKKAYDYYSKLAKNNNIDAIEKCIEYCKENNSYSLYGYYKQLITLTNNLEAKIYVATARFIHNAYPKDNIEYTFNLLKELELLDNNEVLYSLGVIYYDGLLGKSNLKLAFDYFKKAQKLGSYHAYSYLGVYYYDGINVEKNIELGVKYFEMAKNSSNYAKYRLGRHMMENPKMGRTSDINDGYTLIREVSFTVGEASWYIAKILREKKYNVYAYYNKKYYIDYAIKLKCDKGYVERGYLNLEAKNYEEAFNDFKYAYDKGIKEAERPLSLCYKEGYGVEKDEEKARSLIENSNDDVVLYQKAKSLAKDKKYSESIEILKSIVNENIDAKYALAKYYLEGKHIKKNESLAYQYFCELSNAKHEAKLRQFKMMYYGIGVAANKRIAINNLLKCKPLDGEASYIIGLECHQGGILEKSLELAYKYYDAALSKKYMKAKEKKDEVKAILDNIKEIEELKKKREAEEKAKQDVINKMKEEYMNTLYDKHKDKVINIPSLEFPRDFDVLQLSYTTVIYGKIDFNFELKWLEKIVYIYVTGRITFIGYWSKERMDLFQEGLSKYTSKHIDDFLKKYEDYPFKINSNYNYTYEYEY